MKRGDITKMKSIMEKINKVKINRYYDINTEEMTEIYTYSKGAFDLLHNAFTAGYMQGEKAEKARMKRARKAVRHE